MPRTLGQAAGFLLGFWIAIFLSPFTIQIARAEGPAAPAAQASAARPAPELAALEEGLHTAVNAVRTGRHLIPLARSAELDRIARAHSLDMARRGYFSHESPEGANPVDRLARGGADGFTLAAENIGQTNRANPPAEIVRSWLASPDHYRNLVAPPFNTTGIGAARMPDGSVIFTQLYLTFPR